MQWSRGEKQTSLEEENLNSLFLPGKSPAAVLGRPGPVSPTRLLAGAGRSPECTAQGSGLGGFQIPRAGGWLLFLAPGGAVQIHGRTSEGPGQPGVSFRGRGWAGSPHSHTGAEWALWSLARHLLNHLE